MCHQKYQLCGNSVVFILINMYFQYLNNIGPRELDTYWRFGQYVLSVLNPLSIDITYMMTVKSQGDRRVRVSVWSYLSSNFVSFRSFTLWNHANLRIKVNSHPNGLMGDMGRSQIICLAPINTQHTWHNTVGHKLMEGCTICIYFIILIFLTPDDFTHQGESAGTRVTRWVK
jgi:hypothetical protein